MVAFGDQGGVVAPVAQVTMPGMGTVHLATARPWACLPRLQRCGHEFRVAGEDYVRRGPWYGPDRYGVLQLTLAGHGFVEDERGLHTVRTGHAFVLRLPDRHVGWRAGDAVDWEFLWLSFAGGGSEALVDELVARGGHVHALDPRLPAVARWRFLAHGGGARSVTATEGGLLAWELLLACAARLPADQDQARNTDLVRRAMVEVHCRPQVPPDVHSLARRLRVSREHLSRMLRRQLGRSPQDLLVEERLQRAQAMLRSSDLSNRAIAEAIGLSSAGQLIRLLRRTIGLTPAGFRRACQDHDVIKRRDAWSHRP